MAHSEVPNGGLPHRGGRAQPASGVDPPRDPRSPNAPERLLTVQDVCELLQVAQTFVYRHAREMGAIKVGSHLRFKRDNVASWLETCRLSSLGDCQVPVDNGFKGAVRGGRPRRLAN